MEKERISSEISIEDYFSKAKEIFSNYADSFLGDDSFINQNIELKKIHTFNVVNIAKKIACEIFKENEEENIYLSQIAALFHDIGRFPQFSKYRTFNDSLSENHALLGIKVINENSLINNLTQIQKKIIIEAIRAHNMKDIPDNLNGITKKVSLLLRDADKLDIMRVLTDYYPIREQKKNEGLEVNLPDTPGYNKEIIDDIYEHKTIANSKRKNYNDMKLVHLSWIFNLNFDITRSIYKSCGYHNILFKYLPHDEDLHKLHNYIQNFLSAY